MLVTNSLDYGTYTVCKLNLMALKMPINQLNLKYFFCRIVV